MFQQAHSEFALKGPIDFSLILMLSEHNDLAKISFRAHDRLVDSTGAVTTFDFAND